VLPAGFVSARSGASSPTAIRFESAGLRASASASRWRSRPSGAGACRARRRPRRSRSRYLVSYRRDPTRLKETRA
jgi:hypothetical protein